MDLPELGELFHHLLDSLPALLSQFSANYIALSVQVVNCLAEDDRAPDQKGFSQRSGFAATIPVLDGGVGKSCFVPR